MRVANVIEEARLGGPQIRMVRVAEAMAEDVETLVVMPCADSDQFAGLCASHGVRCRRVPLTRLARGGWPALRYLLRFPGEVRKLRRLFRQESAELVHVSGGSWQVKSVIAGWLAGIPVVWHLNDTYVPSVVRRVFRWLVPLADGLIFASTRSRDYYGPLVGKQPSDIIPATVDCAWFDPVLPMPEDRAHAEIAEIIGGGPVIGTVSNVNPIKGLEHLVRAAAILKPRFPTLRVVVAGAVFESQKKYFDGLRAMASDLGVAEQVIWLGHCADVRPVLKRLDVYTCTSLAESSPVSVWEAMAMGLPVVSTDVGDVPVHMVESENGFVVPVGDAAVMAERIGTLLESPDVRAAMGISARQTAMRAFAPEVIATKTRSFYRRILGQREP